MSSSDSESQAAAHAPAPRPASTVVLLRDGEQGMETLMLKRNKALMFAGGYWVFPGGALEPQDIEAADGDVEEASRLAAAREAGEESGLQPKLDDMVLVSHWTTPVAEPKRFATWIYAAPLQAEDEVVVDGSEIHDHLWIGIDEAVVRHERGELAMLPPTIITLLHLASYDSLSQLMSIEKQSPVPNVLPVFALDEGAVTVMFDGDSGYAIGEPGTPGARHRAVLQGERWCYVCDAGATACMPLVRQGDGATPSASGA